MSSKAETSENSTTLVIFTINVSLPSHTLSLRRSGYFFGHKALLGAMELLLTDDKGLGAICKVTRSTF